MGNKRFRFVATEEQLLIIFLANLRELPFNEWPNQQVFTELLKKIENMVFSDLTSLQAHIIELESTKAIGIFPSGYDAPPAQDGQASTFAATGATGGGGGHAQSTGPAPSPQQVTPSTTTPPSGKGKGKGKGKEHAGSTAPSS